MAVIKGSKVVLKVGDGGTPESFDIIAGSRSIRLGLGGSEIDTTSADDIADGVTWMTSISGMADVNISGDWLIKDAATFQQIIGDRLTDVIRNYQVDIPGFAMFSGPGRITQADIDGPFDGVATYTVTLRAAGAWTRTNEVVAPVNTLLPSIAGIPQVGQVLTAMPGIWTGGGIAFTYQWQVDVAGNGTFGNIAGAVNRTYTPVSGDQTDRLRVIVTATNAHSGVAATSAATTAVIAA